MGPLKFLVCTFFHHRKNRHSFCTGFDRFPHWIWSVSTLDLIGFRTGNDPISHWKPIISALEFRQWVFFLVTGNPGAAYSINPIINRAPIFPATQSNPGYPQLSGQQQSAEPHKDASEGQ
jgi:hypothetical protein